MRLVQCTGHFCRISLNSACGGPSFQTSRSVRSTLSRSLSVDAIEDLRFESGRSYWLVGQPDRRARERRTGTAVTLLTSVPRRRQNPLRWISPAISCRPRGGGLSEKRGPQPEDRRRGGPAMAWTPRMASRFVRAEIEEALAHGSTFAAIERDIVEQAPVSDDVRAALWLFAWGSAER